MPRPTISEVARTARVSKATVSRVLNGTGDYLRAETRAKVLQAIESLNYRPSTVARSLSLQRTQTIGVLLAEVSHPFAGDVIRGVEEIALAHAYDIFLCNMMHDPARYPPLIHSLIDKQVDGVLVLTTTLPDPCLAELVQSRVPVVALERAPGAPDQRVGVVSVDFGPGIAQALHHLVELGHRRLGYISSPIHAFASRQNQRKSDAFFQAAAQQGFDLAEIAVAAGNLQVDGGRRALLQLMQRATPPTAIVAGDDSAAMGALWAARDLGLALPQELSIVGLDNLPLAAEVSPPLTTVAYPRYELGVTATQMLLDLLATPTGETLAQPFVRELQTHLIIRGSTAPAPT